MLTTTNLTFTLMLLIHSNIKRDSPDTAVWYINNLYY